MADLPYQAGRSAKRSYADGMISHEERQACVMVAQSVKEAIWRIAAPVHDEKVTGYFDPPPADGEQRIYCLLPFAPSLVERIEEDVADQLQRETFNGPYPGARVAFAAADSQWGPNRKEFSYGHVFKLAGRPTEPLPPSLTRILDNDGRLRQRRRVLSRGETLLLEMGQSLERPKRKKGPDGGRQRSLIGGGKGRGQHWEVGVKRPARRRTDDRKRGERPASLGPRRGGGPVRLRSGALRLVRLLSGVPNPELDEAAQRAMGCWPTVAPPPEAAPLAPATPEEGKER